MDSLPTDIQDLPILVVRGELDHQKAPRFDEESQRILDQGHDHLLLDFRHITYIDSGGLRILLNLLKRVRGEGWLGVIGPSPDVLRTMELAGLTLDPAFRVYGVDQVRFEGAGTAPES